MSIIYLQFLHFLLSFSSILIFFLNLIFNYFFRNFCDEIRFPDWPVGEPLIFLRETLQRWRVEMAKGVEDHAVEEAKIILGFVGGKK